MNDEPKMNYCCDCGWAVKKGLFRKTWYCTCPEIMAKTKKGEISPVNGTKTIEKCTDVRGPFNYSHLETMPDGRKLCKYYKGKFEGWSYNQLGWRMPPPRPCPPRKNPLPCPPLPERVEKAMEFSQMHKKIEELEDSNKEMRELVCEYGLYIADQDYLLRPETISRTIDIMVEEKGKDGWYGNKLKENQKARGEAISDE